MMIDIDANYQTLELPSGMSIYKIFLLFFFYFSTENLIFVSFYAHSDIIICQFLKIFEMRKDLLDTSYMKLIKFLLEG